MAPISFKNLLPSSDPESTEKVDAYNEVFDSLNSIFPGERKKAEARLLEIAETEPHQIVALLLRYYNDEEKERSQEILKKVLTKIAESPAGKEAIILCVSDPNRGVRRGVKKLIEDIWGPQAVPFATLFEQTVVLIGFARRKDVPVDDLEGFTVNSQRTFLSGDIPKAISEISHIMDLVKLRYRNVENLKTYLSDMLKTIPELNKLGVTTSDIEESLKTALEVTKNRQFDYTEEVFEERMRELEIRDELTSLGQTVKDTLTKRPEMKLTELSGMDVWALEKMGELMQMSTESQLVGSKGKAVVYLHDFLVNEFNPFLESDAKARLAQKDPSALFTVYIIGIVSLKILADSIPLVAEEIYQTYYRGLEHEPSILMVVWPEIVLRIVE